MTRMVSMLQDRNITIMVVDDDPDIRELIQNILEADGFKTMSACSGLDALNKLNSLSSLSLPHLILLDYSMPDLNGEEFHHEMSRVPRLSHIPIVLMTANTNLREIMDHMDVEAFISKPMDMDSILQVAHNFTERRNAARYSFLA